MNNSKHQKIDAKLADAMYVLSQQLNSEVPELTPGKQKKLVKKLWLTIVPRTCLLNATLFIDKDAISYASLFGTFKCMGLNKSKFNNI